MILVIRRMVVGIIFVLLRLAPYALLLMMLMPLLIFALRVGDYPTLAKGQVGAKEI